ncbi:MULTISPECIES: histidine phosphatase family protein [unclassified Streptomyces]|uniref:histidine phosphatase family protein n=1 Tax=unclassified Streptomyces TaxID=2593676 RepID=UPI001F04217E|nr:MULTISPECIES: histidine phosphatase family protein [unclassified Streptomyces]MCH0564132.1 histidine phosphatase family protein [Streptomyces sp. MUM 2J]MCH0568435.1 histidine phosphatase family protein [Streptomyces sp. MUM 136J]
MTDLVLVRHGETIWHAENRYTGRSDIPLTPRGREQAEQLAAWAKRARPDALWVSPLLRARDTARPVAEATGLEPREDPRLREIDFGRGEGLTTADMRDVFPEQLAAFQADPALHHLPDGERPADAVERGMAALREIHRLHPDGRVVVVGHSTLNRLLLCHLLGVPLSEYRRLFPLMRNCAITELRFHGTDTAALVQFNTPAEAFGDFPAPAAGPEEETP